MENGTVYARVSTKDRRHECENQLCEVKEQVGHEPQEGWHIHWLTNHALE
jgi:predicted site-specific integrase-resolvase